MCQTVSVKIKPYLYRMCCFSWEWNRARRGLLVPDWFLVLWWLSVVKWMITLLKMLPKKWKNVPRTPMWTLVVAAILLTKVSFENGHALSYVTFSWVWFLSNFLVHVVAVSAVESRDFWWAWCHVTTDVPCSPCAPFSVIIQGFWIIVIFWHEPCTMIVTKCESTVDNVQIAIRSCVKHYTTPHKYYIAR